MVTFYDYHAFLIVTCLSLILKSGFSFFLSYYFGSSQLYFLNVFDRFVFFLNFLDRPWSFLTFLDRSWLSLTVFYFSWSFMIDKKFQKNRERFIFLLHTCQLKLEKETGINFTRVQFKHLNYSLRHDIYFVFKK